MENTVYRGLYNGLILPALRGGFRIMAPFAPKVRRGLTDRQDLINRVRAFRDKAADKPLMLFHCASAGEFQSLKPVADALDRNRYHIVVSFFSPSAKSAASRAQEFDLADYSPEDSLPIVHEYLEALRPDLIAVTKHDVWPNITWCADRRRLPVFLINGNFPANSLRLLPLVRGFHGEIYRSLRGILAVSEEDARYAREFVGDEVPIEVAGDSRYDCVAAAMQNPVTFPEGLSDLCRMKEVLIAGSTHHEDEELLIPILPRLKKKVPELLTVIVPHDPSRRAAGRIRRLCAMSGIRLADVDDLNGSGETDALLVNKTGLLAGLYRLGNMAYVGGGFGKGIHSVLEPFAYGLPVVCGPSIGVSHEARTASKTDILEVVRGRRQAASVYSGWLTDKDVLSGLQEEAKRFIISRTGASVRIAQRLEEELCGKIDH